MVMFYMWLGTEIGIENELIRFVHTYYISAKFGAKYLHFGM